MPGTIKNRRTAQRTRKNILPGKKQAKHGCKGSNGDKAPAARILGNSLFTVSLKSKYGFEVLRKKESKGFDVNEEDYDQMYDDLLATFRHAMKLVKNETTSFDPKNCGLDSICPFAFIINSFKREFLPAGYELNIDLDEGSGEYFFTMYKEVDWPWAWHTFELKTAVEYLLKRNKKLHDLFITVMRCFYSKTGITSWFDGGYGYAEMMMDDIGEYINNRDFESEEEQVKVELELEQLKYDYRKGQVKQYQKLLQGHDYKKPEQLEKMLSNFGRKSPVVQWMYKCIEFLKLQGRISDYEYEELYVEQEGLRVVQQATIIWDYNDAFFAWQEEAVDSDASNLGVIPPYITIPVTKHNRFIDLADLKEREQWMKKLSVLQNEYNEMLRKILK